MNAIIRKERTGFDVKAAIVFGKKIKSQDGALGNAKRLIQGMRYKDALEKTLAAAAVKKRNGDERQAMMRVAVHMTYMENFNLEKTPRLVDMDIERTLAILLRDDDRCVVGQTAFLIQLLGVYGCEISGLRPMLRKMAIEGNDDYIRSHALNAFVWTSRSKKEVLGILPASSFLYRRWAFETDNGKVF